MRVVRIKFVTAGDTFHITVSEIANIQLRKVLTDESLNEARLHVAYKQYTIFLLFVLKYVVYYRL